MQEWRNPIANALELRIFCTNPSMRPFYIWWQKFVIEWLLPSQPVISNDVDLFCPGVSHVPDFYTRNLTNVRHTFWDILQKILSYKLQRIRNVH